MTWLKSLFISVYISGAVTGLVAAVVLVARGGVGSPWLGAAVACAGVVVFFASAFAFPRPRTAPNLPWVFAAAGVGTVLALGLAGTAASPAVATAAAVIPATALYVAWYSRFSDAPDPVLREGGRLPAFTLRENGRTVASADLVAKPALWVFYRGNWCPICVGQIREIAGQYRELARRGVEVLLVSPQPEAYSAELAAKVDAPMRFLTDPGNAAAAILGIREAFGLPAGMQVLGYDSDVPRPTVLITAPGGRIHYCDSSGNYRVRPEPAQFFAVLDRMPAAPTELSPEGRVA